jgi:hypothetical protein
LLLLLHALGPEVVLLLGLLRGLGQRGFRGSRRRRGSVLFGLRRSGIFLSVIVVVIVVVVGLSLLLRVLLLLSFLVGSLGLIGSRLRLDSSGRGRRGRGGRAGRGSDRRSRRRN